MIYRDIIESRSYEYAAPDTPIVIRFGSYDVDVTGFDIDNDEKEVTFLTCGGNFLEIRDLLEIDNDELAEILDHTVYVESLDGGEYFEADDVYTDIHTSASGETLEIFVIFSD